MHKYLTSKPFSYLTLYFILLCGLIIRTFGINWDANQHLHPDERFLTMVTNNMTFPDSISDYLNPKISTLNPHNIGFDFYVYGTFPLKIVRIASNNLSFDSFAYNNVTLVGRLFSALFDTGIILLLFLIGKTIYNKSTGLLASFIYTFAVLPIQLSHFFAVDTFLVFFITLSFYLLIRYIYSKTDFNKFIFSILIGVSIGFAIACKVSAVLFIPILIFGLFVNCLASKKYSLLFISLLLTLFSSYLSIRFANPESFDTNNFFNISVNSKFIANLKTLKSFNDPDSYFPPGIQWISTKPVTFAFSNNIIWGLGLPFGIVVLIGLVSESYIIYKKFNQSDSYFRFINNNIAILLILIWICELFFYQSVQFSKNLRYFYPIYPFCAIISASVINRFITYLTKRVNKYFLYSLSIISTFIFLIWPMSFLSIYIHDHSRLKASEWIYKNIPSGSILSCDLWDDCLPLSIEDKYMNLYKFETLEVFAPDTPQKWLKLNKQLDTIDYLVITSNRAWGSITKVPNKYPLMSKFYSDLFAGRLKFEKIAEFTSFPKLVIGNWSLVIPDEVAEESFTVYDHPKVMIFKRLPASK